MKMARWGLEDKGGEVYISHEDSLENAQAKKIRMDQRVELQILQEMHRVTIEYEPDEVELKELLASGSSELIQQVPKAPRKTKTKKTTKKAKAKKAKARKTKAKKEEALYLVNKKVWVPKKVVGYKLVYKDKPDIPKFSTYNSFGIFYSKKEISNPEKELQITLLYEDKVIRLLAWEHLNKMKDYLLVGRWRSNSNDKLDGDY